MARLEDDAKRLLQRLNRNSQERKRLAERLEGSARIKKPGAAPERQHAPGSHAATGGGLGGDHTAQRGRRSGLEIEAGEVCLGRQAASMRSPATNADSYRCDFTSAGPGAFKQGDGDARWIGIPVAVRVRSGGEKYPRPFHPTVLISVNDNRKGHCRPSQAITLLR